MLGKSANPLLVKTEEQIEAKVPPELQDAYQRIILAGDKVLYSEKTRELVISELHGQGDPATVVGQAVAKLYGILSTQAHGTMPVKAAIPAITSLLCEALDLAEKAKFLTVSPEILADAMHALSSGLMQLMGVDQNKLGLMMQHAQAKQQPDQAPPTAPNPPPVAPAAPATTPQPAPVGGLVAQAQGAGAMSLLLGALGGAGDAAQKLGEVNQKAMVESDLLSQRELLEAQKAILVKQAEIDDEAQLPTECVGVSRRFGFARGRYIEPHFEPDDQLGYQRAARRRLECESRCSASIVSGSNRTSGGHATRADRAGCMGLAQHREDLRHPASCTSKSCRGRRLQRHREPHCNAGAGP
jgi:hypothetical protein